MIARRLFGYLRPYGWWVALAGLLTLPIAPLAAAGPYIFQISIDRYMVPVLKGQIAGAAGATGLAWMALFYAVTIAAGFGFLNITSRCESCR